MPYTVRLIRDLSKYDLPPYRFTEINYALYDALIIRAFDGTHPDSKFTLHRDAAIQAGRPWWPYMFYDFRYPVAQQVPNTLALLGNLTGNGPLMIDVEEWGGYNFPPRTQLLANMKTMYEQYVAVTGLMPLWYFNVAALQYMKPIPEWMLSCPINIAAWGWDNPPVDPWIHWTFHQYVADPDLNEFYGTADMFAGWLIAPPAAPPPPAPVPFASVYKVLVDNMAVRSEPSTAGGNSTVVKRLAAGAIIGPPFDCHIEAKNRVWFHIADGWLAAIHDGKQYLTKVD